MKMKKTRKEIKSGGTSQKLTNDYSFFLFTFSNTVGVEKHSRLFI